MLSDRDGSPDAECVCQDEFVSTQDTPLRHRRTRTYKLAVTIIGFLSVVTLIFQIFFSTAQSRQPTDVILNTYQDGIVQMLSFMLDRLNATHVIY